MRKPIVALGLCLSTSFGAIPAADVLAATPTGSTLSFTPPSSSLPASGSTYRQSSGVSGAAIIQTAMQYIGYPYTATGNSPATGFSCIGFVSYVYRQNGIPLPGDLQDAYAYAPKVAFSNLEPGDVLFFQNTIWPGISHTGIYIGGGRFIHSEWYGKGVRISSFTNDPSDYNYWSQKYLGANRPWTGAAGAAVAAPTATSGNPGTDTGTATPTVTPPAHVASGPTALISVSVNVRGGPGMKHPIQTVASQGTSVVILRTSHGWYKIQLPNGVVGWIVAAGIGRAATPSMPAASRSKGVAPTVGNPTAPARQGAPVQSSRLTAQVRANGLRVHSGPSLADSVITSLPRGARLQVLERRNGWVKILLPNGTTGWVSAAYVGSRAAQSHSMHAVSYTPAATVTKRVVKTTRLSTARVSINVHTGPSLDDAVTGVLAPGAGYRVIGWSNGWAHVVLANGQTGWVSGTVMRGAPTAYGSYATHQVKHASRVNTGVSGTHVLTAGVRMHAAPGVKSRVTGLAAAGTHVRILSSRSGWDLVRLPDGETGYVDGLYVR